MKLAVAIALASSLVASGNAHACEVYLGPNAKNTPTQHGQSCIFDNAGDGNLLDVGYSVSGKAARDQGQMKVTQLLTFTRNACSWREALLIADCDSNETMLIWGLEPPPEQQIAGAIYTRVKYAIGPEGRVSLPLEASLTEMSDRARAANLEVDHDAASLQSKWRSHDRFDEMCGCRLHYPDSAGAAAVN